MPAVVSSTVRSSAGGTSDAEGMRRCSRWTKNSRYRSRISSEVIEGDVMEKRSCRDRGRRDQLDLDLLVYAGRGRLGETAGQARTAIADLDRVDDGAVAMKGHVTYRHGLGQQLGARTDCDRVGGGVRPEHIQRLP